MEGDIPKSIY